MSNYPYDTEEPPLLSFGPRSALGVGRDRGEFQAGPDIKVDFTRNPEAGIPFFDWLKSGEAWAAFGDWYDVHARKYEKPGPKRAPGNR